MEPKRYSPEWWREYRKKNAEKLRSYHREFDKKQYREKSEQENARRVRWQLKNKEKVAAHRKVRQAIKTGVLTKDPCRVCNIENSVAHHDDYNFPLQVIWLCEIHHKERHRLLVA